MNELKNRRLGPGLALLLVVSIFAVGGWAHWQFVSNAHAELARMHAQITMRQQQVSQGTADAQLQKLEEELRALDQVIPQRNEATRLIEQISRTLAGMSLSQRSVTSGQPTRMQGLEQVPVHVRFAGSFESVFDVLGEVESSLPSVRLQQLVVSGDVANPGQPLSVTGAFVAFHRSGQSALVSVANGARR